MTARPDNEQRDRPTGELLKELANETTTLVRQEIDLMPPAAPVLVLPEPVTPQGAPASLSDEGPLG